MSSSPTCRGFGLRVIPDRTVDDGWTVRINLAATPEIRLEIDTYVGAATN